MFHYLWDCYSVYVVLFVEDTSIGVDLESWEAFGVFWRVSLSRRIFFIKSENTSLQIALLFTANAALVRVSFGKFFGLLLFTFEFQFFSKFLLLFFYFIKIIIGELFFSNTEECLNLTIL